MRRRNSPVCGNERIYRRTFGSLPVKGQKSHVENQVRIRGHSVAVPETHDRNQHRPLVRVLETLRDEVAQFVHVELRGFNHHIREFADRVHQRAFMRQTFPHGKILSQRMRAPRLAVPPQEGILVRFDENQRDGMISFQVFQEWRQFSELRALACVYQQGRSRKVSFTRSMQFRKNGDELHGKIVHAVEAHVFEGTEDSAFAGTGESGKDDQLPGVVSRLRLHG